MSASEVHFGGPDLPRGCLRDLLADRVRAVPAGGSIDWVTYYFRDRELAGELLAARRRGVDVRLTLEGRPRTERANRAVVGMLEGDAGLGSGLRLVHDPGGGPLRALRPRVHEKLYCFSPPRCGTLQPLAMVGSFNPSGDVEEREPDVIDEIRDQDRGFNALVSLRDPALVRGLVDHARRLHRARHGAFDRLHPRANRTLRSGLTSIHFWPSVRPHPVVRRLAACSPQARVRLAASHLSGVTARRTWVGLARRGVRIEIVAESTERRVPRATERALREAGVRIGRIRRADGVPMHCKFALIEDVGVREVVFGSFNWTERSLRLNRELGVLSREPALYAAFDAQWRRLAGQARDDEERPAFRP